MCEPITAAVALSAAAGVATTAASVVGQAKAAKAQTKVIREQAAVVQEESRRAASGQLFDQMRATRRERARILVAAGEAGLSTDSNNVEMLLMDSAMQGELQGSRTLANLESRNAATLAEEQSMLSQNSSPTLLGSSVQVGASAAQGWAEIQRAKIRTKR